MSEQQQTQQNETTILTLTHVSGIIFGFIVSLVIFFIKKDGSEYFNNQIKEALNFQITMAIALFGTSIILSFLSLLTTPVILLINLVLCIQAAIAVNSNQEYKYPVALRLIK